MEYLNIHKDKICNVIRKSSKAFEVVIKTGENEESRTTVRYHLNVDTKFFCVKLEIFIQNALWHIYLCRTKEATEKIQNFWLELCDAQITFANMGKSEYDEKISSLAREVFS